MGVDIAFGPRMNQRCGLKEYISYLKGSYLYRAQQEAEFKWTIEAISRQFPTISKDGAGSTVHELRSGFLTP